MKNSWLITVSHKRNTTHDAVSIRALKGYNGPDLSIDMPELGVALCVPYHSGIAYIDHRLIDIVVNGFRDRMLNILPDNCGVYTEWLYDDQESEFEDE